MKTDAPCRTCCERSADCHGQCEQYRAWKEEHDRRKAEQAEEAAADYRYRSYRHTVYDRNDRIRKLKMNGRGGTS